MHKQTVLRTLLTAIFLVAPGSIGTQAQNGAATATTPMRAGSSTSGETAGTADKSDSSGTGQAAKHTWTNEDVGGLRNNSTISTVGSAKSQKPTVLATSSKTKSKPTSFYRNQITKLQAQIPPIDQQIAELQAALSGKPTDQPRKYWGTTIDDWHSELARLQKKRADIQRQISAIEDEARHDGIPTNALH